MRACVLVRGGGEHGPRRVKRRAEGERERRREEKRERASGREETEETHIEREEGEHRERIEREGRESGEERRDAFLPLLLAAQPTAAQGPRDVALDILFLC